MKRLIVGVALLVCIGAGVWWYVQRHQQSTQTQSTVGVAKLDYILNQVESRAAGKIDWQRAQSEQQLFEEDAVKTDKESVTIIRYGESDSVRLEENSLLVIRALKHFADSDEANLSILSGDLVSESSKFAMKIETPAGLTTVQPSGSLSRPSRIMIRVAADHSATISVVDGNATTTTIGGQSIPLGRGEGIKLNAGPNEVAPAKVALPKTIEIADIAQVEVTPTETGSTLTFKMKSTAPRHHLQVARDSQFLQLVINKYFDGEKVEIEGLPPGTYYWNVADIDANEMHGGFSAAQKLEVTTAAVAKPPPKVEKPTKPKPPIVTISDQKNEVIVPYTGIAPQCNWQWKKSARAVAYQLEIFADAGLKRRIFISERLRQNKLNVVIDALGPGTYYWQTRELDFRGKVLTISAARKLTLQKQ